MFKDPMSVASRTSKCFGDQRPMLFAQQQNPSCGFGRPRAHFSDATQKELEPSFPVTRVAHGLQPFVVRLAMGLEVVRQVEHRLSEYTTFTEEKRHQQPADAAVAVKEGVNGLELRVGQPDLDEKRDVVLFMQEGFELR